MNWLLNEIQFVVWIDGKSVCVWIGRKSYPIVSVFIAKSSIHSWIEWLNGFLQNKEPKDKVHIFWEGHKDLERTAKHLIKSNLCGIPKKIWTVTSV